MDYYTKELTLLSAEEIWGLNGGKQLDVFKKYGKVSAITDLVILTGGDVDYLRYYQAPDDDSLKGRSGCWYTRSSNGAGNVRCVNRNGADDDSYRDCSNLAIRPALRSPVIFDLISSKRVSGYNGTEEVEYGEYPQYAPSSDVQELLEQEFKRGCLHKTGKNYTFDSTSYRSFAKSFQPITYDEYEYKGKKYIRVEARSDFSGYYFKLSNGETYREGDNVWVEVSPVRWLVDDRTQTLLSKRGLLSGIKFNKREELYRGDFSTTKMKEYLDKYMLRDLTQSSVLVENVTPEEIEEQLDISYSFEQDTSYKGKSR